MKTRRWITLAPAVFALVASASTLASARAHETVNQVYDTSDHPRLSLRNINGDATIEGWDKNRIEVTAVKSASSQDRLDDLDVKFDMDHDYLRIGVDIDSDHHWSHHEEGPNVEFTIHVPRGTRISGMSLVNGDVEITNVTGDVEASSVNGTVSGEKLGGDINLSTVNGRVELVATADAGAIRLHSVNGDVMLTLPKKFDARIEAGTLHGNITAVEGMDVEATSFTGSSMRGTIGKGGMKVDLNTVNGSIRIQREGDSGTKNRE